MTNSRISVHDLNLCIEKKRRDGEIQAIFFDLDGTLIDTMDLHYLAYRQVFREIGGDLGRADFDFHSGPPAKTTIPLFAKASGVELIGDDKINEIHTRKKELLESFLTGNTLSFLPAVEILMEWHSKVPVCVVTSGNARGACAILRASGIFHHLAAIITADDVKYGKPDPEPYLRAITQLNVDPRHGIAFEDHNNGIKSAKSARLDVVDVRTATLISGENG